MKNIDSTTKSAPTTTKVEIKTKLRTKVQPLVPLVPPTSTRLCESLLSEVVVLTHTVFTLKSRLLIKILF